MITVRLPRPRSPRSCRRLRPIRGSWRDPKRLAGVLVAVALSIALAGALVPAIAQGPLIRLDGRVQWIAGQTLMLMTDFGQSVGVDLASVDLDQYRGLTQGVHVIVIGRLSEDYRKVYATSVTYDTRWESP